MPDEPQESVSLKRSLSLRMLIFYGVGTILGLGIYILLGKAVGRAGTLAPLSFLIAAIIAGFSGASFGELAARIPKSAGEVNYVQQAFNKRSLSMLVGWMIVISAIVSTATAVNGYVGYVHVFIELPPWIIISVIVLILGSIAVWGITESAATITIITIIEVGGLLFVIYAAGDNLAALPERWHQFVPSFSATDWKAIMGGAFLVFFTFIGFEDMVNVAEEAENPQRDMPRAILISLAIITILYLIVTFIACLGLTQQELATSDAPLANILANEGPGYEKIISGIGLIAIINGVLVQIVMIARVLYGMAEKSMAPRLFHRVHPKTRTPVWATVISVVFVLVLALLFKLEALAKATNYILLSVFIVINLALWVIKRRNPKPEGIRTFPLGVPITGFFLSIALLLIQIF